MGDKMELIAAALAVVCAFLAGCLLGKRVTEKKDLEILLLMTRPEKKDSEPDGEKAASQPTAKSEQEELEEMRRAEEDARIQKLLDNIEAYGTDLPQHEIRPREDM